MSFFIKDILGETSSDRTTSNNTSRDLPSSETTAFTNFTKTDSGSYRFLSPIASTVTLSSLKLY